MKAEDDEDGEGHEGEGERLSKSGKEMKKLLGKSGLGDDEDELESDDEDSDVDFDEDAMLAPPMLYPKSKADAKVKPETVDEKPKVDTTKASAKQATVKTETKAKTPPLTPQEQQKGTKRKADAVRLSPAKAPKAAAPTPPPPTSAPPSTSGITEEAVRAAIKKSQPVKSADLVKMFKQYIKSTEDKELFARIVKKLSKIQKIPPDSNNSFIVLK
eukprot:jgi/Chlat1/4382/Chrsp29S04614